ncbi:hypothetical protein EHS17_12465, partial [Rhodobacteraceae bacterium CH30]
MFGIQTGKKIGVHGAKPCWGNKTGILHQHCTAAAAWGRKGGSGLGTRDSGLGTRDSGLGTRDSGLGTR